MRLRTSSGFPGPRHPQITLFRGFVLQSLFVPLLVVGLGLGGIPSIPGTPGCSSLSFCLFFRVTSPLLSLEDRLRRVTETYFGTNELDAVLHRLGLHCLLLHLAVAHGGSEQRGFKAGHENGPFDLRVHGWPTRWERLRAPPRTEGRAGSSTPVPQGHEAPTGMSVHFSLLESQCPVLCSHSEVTSNAQKGHSPRSTCFHIDAPRK
jgi:hypothetical protein